MELDIIIQLAVLLLAFEIKHYIADYPLQQPYMYENKGKEEGWLSPLSDHAAIHAFGTFIIVGAWTLKYGTIFMFPFYMALFDYITHLVIDRWKATKPYGPNTSEFWLYLGQDQMFHHIVGFIIIIGLMISL